MFFWTWGAGGGESKELQRNQDGRKTLRDVGTTLSSIGQLHRTTCALKHTRCSHYPAI